MATANVDPVVAIVGLAGRFPGAGSPEELWRNVRAGRVSVTPISDAALRARGVGEHLIRHHNYVKVEAAIADYDRFDADFFGINESVAAAMDPQHRLLLECTWLALEDAGYRPDGMSVPVGVFAGRSTSDYDRLVKADDRLIAAVGPLQARLYAEKDTLATFISYKLDLRGPSMSVQTACSSSLVAMHLAIQSLLSVECDFAVVGGVDAPFPQGLGYLYQPGGVLSPDGQCRPFDAAASGTLAGCGVGVLVMRRYGDAVAAGDNVRALVRGSAVNNDGYAKLSFPAPSAQGQAAAITEALAVANVPAGTIDYVETHGTGTPLGDPIEVAGLTAAYREQTSKTAYCALGSIKGNIGHLGAAAGVASVIKTVLALEHAEIPPMANFTSPNPEIPIDESPFYVPTVVQPWPGSDRPRRAGVSSFGMGGTNAHVILEHAERVRVATPDSKYPFLLAVSAKTRGALGRTVPRLADHLAAHSDLPIKDVAFTLSGSRAGFGWRVAAVARDQPEAVSRLRAIDPGAARPVRDAPPPVGLVIPGPLDLRSVDPLGEVFPAFRAAVAEAVEVAADYGIDLTPAPDQRPPAVGSGSGPAASTVAVAYATGQLLAECGVTLSTTWGAGPGELAAACLDGRCTLAETMRLSAEGVGRGSGRALPADGSESGRETGGSTPLAAVLALAGDDRLADDLVSEHPGASIRSLLGTGDGDSPVTAFLAAMGELYVSGVPVDLYRVNRAAGRRTSLPGYPFEGRRYWPSATHAITAGQAPIPAAEREVTVSARTDVEVRLVKMTADAGGVAMTDVGVDTSFIELGLDSIALLQLTQMIEDEFGVTVAFRALFHELPTVSRLAASIAADRGAPDTDQAPVPEAPPPPAIEPPVHGDPRSLDAGPAERPDSPEVPAEPTRTPSHEGLRPSGRSLASVITQQLDLMAAQLRLLGADTDEGTTSGGDPARREPDAVELPGRPATGTRPPGAETFVPFQPSSDDQPADGAMIAYARRLASRVTARTATSAKLAYDTRSRLANERATANFRSYTKEMLYPLSVARASGGLVWDVDGNKYVDLAMGFGALLFGHDPDVVVQTLHAQLGSGIGLGLESPEIGEVARLLCDLTGVERVAFCNSGTEAVLTAIRLARTVTRRPKIAVFAGGYHGMLDNVLARPAADGTAPLAPGVAEGTIRDTIVLDFGDAAALRTIERQADELAAVLVEPRQSRRPGLDLATFLRELREVTRQGNVALVFDEIITGFRTHPGGMQALLGIEADLVTYGKAIGAGMPVAAVGGSARYLDAIDGGFWDPGDDSYPSARQTFFAGTYFKSPLVVSVLRQVLGKLSRESPGLQNRLDERTASLVARLDRVLAPYHGQCTISSFSSLFRFTFADDRRAAADFFYFGLLARGVYIPETRSCFLSTAHTDADLDVVVEAVDATLRDLADNGVLAAPTAAPATAPGTVPTTTPGPAAAGERAPVSAQQECMLDFLGGPSDEEVFYNEHEAVLIEGELVVGRLRHAVEVAIRENASLRTVFGHDETRYFQLVTEGADSQVVELDTSTDPDPDERAKCLLAEVASRPFDLTAGPLFRPYLVRVAPARHYLLLAAHHLVTDGWSHAVLLQEISNAYHTGAQATEVWPATPSEVPSYAEFARIQRDRLEAILPDEMAFWEDYLAGCDPTLSLADLEEPCQGLGYRAGFASVELGAGQTAAVVEFGRRAGASFFMTVLAALSQVVRQRTGRSDLVVATPMANRSVRETQRTVGFFANSPLVRVDTEGAQSFADLVHRAREALLPVAAHQELPAEMVLRRLGLPQHRVRVGYEDSSVKGEAALALGDTRIRSVGLPFHRKLRRELNIDVLYRGDSTEISVEYAVERFTADAITGLLTELRRALLEGVASAADPASSHAQGGS